MSPRLWLWDKQLQRQDHAGLHAVREVGRTRQDARDLDILNRNAEALNREAEDVLNFQTPL